MICNVSISIAIFTVTVSFTTYRMEQVTPDSLSYGIKKVPSSRAMSLHF